MTEQQNLLNHVINNETLWVQLDEQNRILNWGSTALFEKEGYIPIEMPQDEFFFKTLGDFVEYGHKYYKVVDGKAVLNTEEYQEIPEGYGVIATHSDGSIYFDTRKFMAKKDEIVHEVFFENLQFYSIRDGALQLDETALMASQKLEKESRLREYRNYILLPAFDKWERAMLVGRTKSSDDIYEWYKGILDLDIKSFNNIPEPIAYYLKGCHLETF